MTRRNFLLGTALHGDLLHIMRPGSTFAFSMILNISYKAKLVFTWLDGAKLLENNIPEKQQASHYYQQDPSIDFYSGND
jgi:hypothetical protein